MNKLMMILLLSVAQWATAQNEGTLRLYLSPPAEAVAIDGNIIEYGNSINLKPGKYFLQAWSPNKELLDTLIQVKSGEVINFFHRFENSKTYNQYLADNRAYSKERNQHFTLPVITTLATIGALTFTIIKGQSLYEESQEKYEAYKYAGYNIDERQKEFENARDKYRGYYYAQFAEYALLGISSYFLYKGIRWVKANPKPQLEKDKNPFKLNQVGFIPNQYGGYGLGLIIDIN